MTVIKKNGEGVIVQSFVCLDFCRTIGFSLLLRC